MTTRRRKPSNGDISGRKYRNARDRFRAKCEALQINCHLCGGGIDYSLPGGEPNAFELDHFYARATHPHLTDDAANWRASHSDCNRARGSKPVRTTLGNPSRVW